MSIIDPVKMIAMKRSVDISAEIEVQLIGARGTNPIIAMLAKAKDEAANAMVMLIREDPMDPGKIAMWQNQVLQFDNMVRWLSQLVKDGFEADRQIGSEEREELADLLAQNPDMLDPQEAYEADIVENLRDA